MKQNSGTIDRLIRVVAGLALLYIGFFDNPIVSAGTSKTIIKYLAFVPLLTGLSGFCPMYVLIGLDTRGGKDDA